MVRLRKNSYDGQKLLDYTNNKHNLDPYIIDILPCRKWIEKKKIKTAIKCCMPRTLSLLELSNHTKRVYLGSDVIKAVYGSKAKINDLRLGPAKNVDNIKTVFTYDADAVVSNYSLWDDFYDDIKKLNKKSKDWAFPQYITLDEMDKVLNVLDKMNTDTSLRDIVIDIECAVDKKKSAETHITDHRAICFGIAINPNVVIVIGKNIFATENPTEFKKKLLELLYNKNLIAHNGQYDLKILMNYLSVNDIKITYDTILMHYALDERPGTHALDRLGREFLHSPKWKELKGNLDNVPPVDLYRYNALDCTNTFRLFEIFKEQLNEKKLNNVHDFLVKCSNMLAPVELQGTFVDVDHLNKLKSEYSKRIATLLLAMGTLAGDPNFNPRSTKQIMKILESKEIKLPNTQAKTLKKYRETNTFSKIFISFLLEYRKLDKVLGTYVLPLIKKNKKGLVSTNFKLFGTVTGRISSSEPNLQNIPRDKEVRKIFSAREGNFLIQADYSAAELRVMAYLSRDKYLLDVLNDPDRDIHSEVAIRRHKDKYTREPHRFQAKKVVYGLAYGMGTKLLSEEIDTTVKEADKFKKIWFDMIPGVMKWRQSIIRKINREGYLQVPKFGHVRRFNMILDCNKAEIERSGLSMLPQNMASNINLASAVTLADAGYLEYIRLVVHDAIILELPNGFDTSEIKEIMEEVGYNYVDRKVIMPVELKKGPNWGYMKEE